jgi:hypothetical protein
MDKGEFKEWCERNEGDFITTDEGAMCQFGEGRVEVDSWENKLTAFDWEGNRVISDLDQTHPNHFNTLGVGDGARVVPYVGDSERYRRDIEVDGDELVIPGFTPS